MNSNNVQEYTAFQSSHHELMRVVLASGSKLQICKNTDIITSAIRGNVINYAEFTKNPNPN